ncbi:MAG: ImmA/IrrE family metallo-endopeptidase [Gammaproteobacteria bacterium]|nr:ImmA/IrrE family metallo-endopeptidase [Gammaproteobacteria bacterium]
MGGQVERLSEIEFRKHSTTSAQDRAKAEVIVIERLEDYLAIEDILELAALDDPFEGLVTDHIESFDAVDELANELRKEWKLGTDPIPSMTALLEGKGIKVIEEPLPERFDGLACHVSWSGEKPPVHAVVVSSRTNIERKRFNLSHELAHRVIRATGNPNVGLEKAMNRFAGAFLVPAEHLFDEVGIPRHKITYPEIMRLKRFYGVSAAAMLMRLEQVGILSRAVIQYAFRTYARSWRTAEPEPFRDEEGFGAFERPQRFESLVWRALGEELISPVRAAQLLRLTLSTVEREIRGSRGQ